MAKKPATPATAADAVIPASPNALRITSAREGFRRAGHAWSKTPTDIALADLSEEQIAALRAETMLTIEEVELA